MFGRVMQVLHDFLGLIYPSCCLSCQASLVKGERLICSDCLLELPQTNFHKHQANELFRRLAYQQCITSAVALFKFGKSGRVQQLLHSLKYRNHPEIGYLLGLYYGERLRREWLSANWDVLIPIPLHPRKKRRRGYNQSEEFARGLGESLNVLVDSLVLTRTVYTSTQTKRSKVERWDNVRNVFRVVREENIMRKSIAIIDDVVTTGSTIEAAASVLLQAGCKDITVISLAYAGA